jgi:hypothetical protein
MDKVSITLYDIFGYLMPGFIGLLALVVFFWSIFLPDVPAPFFKWELGTAGYVCVVLAAYYLGHVVQAFSSFLFKYPDDALVKKGTSEIKEIIVVVSERIKEDLPPDQELQGRNIVKICDEATIQFGAQGERDVFVYREGFYRGMSVAFLLLAIALTVRLFQSDAGIQLAHSVYYVTRPQLFVIALLMAIFAYLMKNRYEKFAELRALRPILAFFTLLNYSCLRQCHTQEQVKKKEDVNPQK